MKVTSLNLSFFFCDLIYFLVGFGTRDSFSGCCLLPFDSMIFSRVPVVFFRSSLVPGFFSLLLQRILKLRFAFTVPLWVTCVTFARVNVTTRIGNQTVTPLFIVTCQSVLVWKKWRFNKYIVIMMALHAIRFFIEIIVNMWI